MRNNLIQIKCISKSIMYMYIYVGTIMQQQQNYVILLETKMKLNN